LRAANDRFVKRFRTLERLAHERDQELADLDIDALDQLWEEAKQIEHRENAEVDR
jgi:uncharacterized protein YabN with tetrapyrrole methylase and pyrophosphatase domain